MPGVVKVKDGGHVWFHCRKECSGCWCCNGGLSMCRVCGAFEGQLLTTCPGYKLNQETLDACYSGNVRDFSLLKAYAAAGYNIRKRRW